MRTSKQQRTRARRSAATPRVAAWAALLALLAAVTPVLAVEGPTMLYDPAVSPRAGSPPTTIAFTVTYRNREGSPPDHVSVVIDGAAHSMTAGDGTDWKSGVAYRWSTTLPAGTHTVSYEAADTRRFSGSVDGGSVTITALPEPTPPPSPTASPTPQPTTQPTPTPRPTTQPTPTPRPTAAPTSPVPPAADDPAPTPGVGGSGAPAAGGSTNGTGSAGTGTAGSGSAGSGSAGTGSAGTGDSGAGTIAPGTGGGPFGVPNRGGNQTDTGMAPGSAGAGWSDGSGDGAGRSGTVGPSSRGSGPAGSERGNPVGLAGVGAGGEPAATADSTTMPGGTVLPPAVVTGGPGWPALASTLATLGFDRPPSITLVPMLISTTGAMTLAFAFAIFGKKRRDEAPPAPDDVLQANAARGHGTIPGSEVVNGVVRGAVGPAQLDVEAGMPRWRRPSLLEARKADPTRFVAATQRMSFDHGAIDAIEGRERRVIRYAVVRLLDAPDELRSTEIGQLDQGDEVQLLERSGSYWLVLCPDGRQGWLHKMTLGEVISDDLSNRGWAVDDNVLGTLLAARARN